MICYDTCEFNFFFKYIYDFLKTIFVTNDRLGQVQSDKLTI